ncbi:MAG TPA: hypothetical protein PK006_04560 [Saprospiraceae bacterium]|nr:hypothetical protein [Saprospiraceae bacterium]
MAVVSQNNSGKTSNKKPAIPQEIKQTINGFLQWYKANIFKLYEYNLTAKDSAGNYIVDTVSCSKYLKALKKSGFISSEYVRLWADYFRSQGEKFIISPQNEGPPEGFDFDLVLHTQEPEIVFQDLGKLQFSSQEIKNKTAVIEVTFPKLGWTYSFELSKIKNKWFIDYISLKEPN